MKHRPTLAAAALATVAAALLPAAAGAATTATYDFQYDVTYAYQHHVARSGGGGTDEDTSWRAVGTMSGLVMEDDVVMTRGTQAVRAISAVKGSFTETAFDGVLSQGCSLQRADVPGPATLVAEGDPSAPQMRLALIAVPGVALVYDCEDRDGERFSETHSIVNVFDLDGTRVPGLVPALVPVPDATRERATVPIDATLPDDECPGYRDDTISCVMSVKGTATYERTKLEVDEDDIPLAPIVPKRSTIDRKAKKTKTKVTCQSACEVRIRIFPEPGRRGGRPRAHVAAARPVAQRTLRLPGGGPVDVTVPLDRAARRAVLRAGAARLVLDITPEGGEAVRRESVARVPR